MRRKRGQRLGLDQRDLRAANRHHVNEAGFVAGAVGGGEGDGVTASGNGEGRGGNKSKTAGGWNIGSHYGAIHAHHDQLNFTPPLCRINGVRHSFGFRKKQRRTVCGGYHGEWVRPEADPPRVRRTSGRCEGYYGTVLASGGVKCYVSVPVTLEVAVAETINDANLL